MCSKQAHERKRAEKRKGWDGDGGGRDIRVKRGFREMERTGGEEGKRREEEKAGWRGEEGNIRGAGEERGLNESRRKCMRHRARLSDLRVVL